MKVLSYITNHKVLTVVGTVVVVGAAGGSVYAFNQMNQPVANVADTHAEASVTPKPSVTPETKVVEKVVDATPTPSTTPEVTPTPSASPEVSDSDIFEYMNENVAKRLGQPCFTTYQGIKNRNFDYKDITADCNEFIEKYPNVPPSSMSSLLMQYILEKRT